MKFFNYLVVFLILFNFNSYSEEKTKIRYIDLEFVLKNSTVGKKINKDALNERNKRINENKKLEENLEKQKKDILSKQKILSKEEFEKKVISHQEEVKK